MLHQLMGAEAERETCSMDFCLQTKEIQNNNNDNRDSSCCECPRKRKEHDDDLPDMKETNMGQECKYSKSDDDVVGRFMINWIRRSSDDIQEDFQVIKDDQNVPEETPKWSWFHRERKDSSKENSGPMEEEDRWSPVSSNLPEKFMSPSNYLEENNNFTDKQTSETKSSPKSSKKLSKKLSVIESKIEEAGAEIEARTGYRLSIADKMKVPALGKLKLEQVNLRLKQDMKTSKEVKKEEIISRTKRFSVKKSAEEDKDKMIQKMNDIRLRNERPFHLDLMTVEQMFDEKMDLQRHLTDYETVHGLAGEQGDKNIMADLYERYRLVLRQTRRQSLKSDTSMTCLGDLASIPEDESVSLHLSSEGKRISVDVGRRRSWCSFGTGQRKSWSNLDTGQERSLQDLPLVQLFSDNREMSDLKYSKPEIDQPCNPSVDITEESPYHTMSREDLSTTLKRLKDEKKQHRKQIKNFQTTVKEQTGKKALKEEKEDLEAYKLYKDIKCKVKLVDALLSKYSVVILDR